MCKVFGNTSGLKNYEYKGRSLKPSVFEYDDSICTQLKDSIKDLIHALELETIQKRIISDQRSF